MIHPKDFTIYFDPTTAVNEYASIVFGVAVDDLMFIDIESYPLDIPGIVERKFDWAERITDRIGE